MSEEHISEEEISDETGGDDPGQVVEQSVVEEEGEPLSLEEQLAQAQTQAAEYLDGWQRSQAELANVKKRVERERAGMHVRARITVIARFLEVFDDFERAMENAPQESEGNGWTDGLALIQRKFVNMLEAEGVTEIEAEGQEFDPALHQSISQQPSDEHQEGQIITVVQKGYLLGEQLVRPARVIVAE